MIAARTTNTEGIRQSSPRLSFATPGKCVQIKKRRNPEGLRRWSLIPEPSQLDQTDLQLLPQGFKANPGLELANTFGVNGKIQTFFSCPVDFGSRHSTYD